MSEPTAVPAEAGSEEQLVIALRVPRWARLAWPAISVVFGFGSVAWIVLAPSWASVIYGGVMVGSLAWAWGARWAAGRARGGQPLQIVATRAGISSPLWTIAWDRVARIWIGPAAGGIQALHIETMKPEDVRWARSKTLRLNARAGNAMNIAPIQLPQSAVDRPLTAIAEDFRRLAGRALT